MRTLLMAGTALMLMGGVALAQTPAGGQPSTASPNSTGVTGQLPGTTSGNMSGSTSGSMSNGSSAGVSGSGGMGTTASPRSSSATGSTGSTTAMQPAMPSGDHTMPTQRRSTMSKGSMSNGSMNKSAYISHHMGRGMPAGKPAGAYLHMAQHAVMKHDKMMARDALGRAETDLLTNSYVEGSVNGPISTPAISDIRSARQAVTSGDYHSASMMIHKAMMDMHGGGMMHHSGMMNHSGMGSSGAMGNTGMMNHGGMNNGSMGNGSMGNGTSTSSTGTSSTGMSHSAVSGSMASGSMQGKQDSTMNKSMTNSTTSSQ